MENTREHPRHEYLTVGEAAELLRIGRSTAYRAVACGDLPTIRIGRAIRVPRRELAARVEGAAK